MADKANQKKGQSSEKPLCKYGLLCYRKNAEHHRRYRHPSPLPSNGTLKPHNDTSPNVSPKVSPKKRLTEDESGKPSVKELEVGNVEKELLSPRRRRSEGERPPSPIDPALNIREKFLVAMPPDFFELWEFCCSVDNEHPSDAFAELGLHLVGPYDVLSKKIGNKHIISDNILRHWRYYYDPPEFQTVIKRDGDDWYHIGYFRDDPSEMPSSLASNSASVGPKFKLMGDNIFAALNFELTSALKRSSSKFVKMKFEAVQKDLQKYAEKKKYSLKEQTPRTKARNKLVVAKTFHGFGIVVPYDKKRDVGYRPLPETDGDLKSILTRIADCQNEDVRLQERMKLDDIETNLQFANDECDFGMGLELGLDLFCFGDSYFHQDILTVLPLAYDLLQRPEYGRIIRSHLQDRRKGDKLSIINE